MGIRSNAAGTPVSKEIHVGTHDLSSRWHELQLNPVDEEIARQACICDIRILDPGVIERVVAGDAGVCGRRNEKAFQKLRKLVGLHYALTNDSVAALGPEASAKILDQIRERLGKRFALGGDRS
jgi:hypothetical protein